MNRFLNRVATVEKEVPSLTTGRCRAGNLLPFMNRKAETQKLSDH